MLISDLMSEYGVKDWREFRLSRKGNRVAGGYGIVPVPYGAGTGEAYCYWVTAVFRKDGTVLQHKAFCYETYGY